MRTLEEYQAYKDAMDTIDYCKTTWWYFVSTLIAKTFALVYWGFWFGVGLYLAYLLLIK